MVNGIGAEYPADRMPRKREPRPAALAAAPRFGSGGSAAARRAESPGTPGYGTMRP